MSMTYSVPRSITYGECALEALGTLKGARAMLVTGGSSMKKHGFLDRAQQILEQAGFAVRVFDGVEPNPSVETVQRGAREITFSNANVPSAPFTALTGLMSDFTTNSLFAAQSRNANSSDVISLPESVALPLIFTLQEATASKSRLISV